MPNLPNLQAIGCLEIDCLEVIVPFTDFEKSSKSSSLTVADAIYSVKIYI
jgi:hypothetical protein